MERPKRNLPKLPHESLVIAELSDLRPFEVVMSPVSAMSITSLLQLALRYPHLVDSEYAERGRRFIQSFIEHCKRQSATNLAMVMEAGSNKDYDGVPLEEVMTIIPTPEEPDRHGC